VKIHRSIAFWFDVLLVIFICWAWRDSYRYGSGVMVPNWSCSNFWGGVHVSHAGTGTGQWSAQRERVARASALLFQRPYFLRGQGKQLPPGYRWSYESPSSYEWASYFYRYYTPDMWVLFIPHWLIILTIVILWLGLLVWRGQRIKRSRMRDEE